LQLMESEQGAQ